MSPVRFHRVLRRGREFGSELKPEDALTPPLPNEPERCLHFICLNANILRQFEFLQNAWMMNTKFSGLTNESDPLLGNRAELPGCPVTNQFTKPEDGIAPRRVSGLPQFVTVRGGANFFCRVCARSAISRRGSDRKQSARCDAALELAELDDGLA